MLTELLSIYEHFEKKGFVLVARRDFKQYLLHMDSMGSPFFVRRVEAPIVVQHHHVGHGVYELNVRTKFLGNDEPSLDPICEAVHRKGWSRSLIHIKLRDADLWVGGPLLYHQEIEKKHEWDGTEKPYYIVRAPASKTHVWGIHVHLNDNGHISIHVAVPHVYEDPEELQALLGAIATLPHASNMQGVHPAMLASV